MEKKLSAIDEAAALLGADPSTLTEDQAINVLRRMVMTNESIRIRKGLASFNRSDDGVDDE